MNQPMKSASECIATLSGHAVRLNVIAKALGCTRQALYLWRQRDENGEGGRRISPKRLEKLNRITNNFLAYIEQADAVPAQWTDKTFALAVRRGAKPVAA